MNNLTAISDYTKLSGFEVKMLFDNLRHSISSNIFDRFAKSSKISDKECLRATGLNIKQFNELSCELKSLKDTASRTKSQALATYLFRLKTGLDYRTLAALFGLEAYQNIGNYCAQVKDALLSDFVPKHLGANHLAREEWISHNTIISKKLFDVKDDQLILIADGTYSYCQKSKDNFIQRRTYSMQKKRSLKKPFVICSTDGLILDVYGLYDATKNDALIMQEVLDTDNHLLRLIKEGDHLIVDRGFRDSINTLQNDYNLTTHMPACVPPNQKQLTTYEANESRFVTKCRWPVEVVNGLLKTLFRANDKVKKNVNLENTLSDLRISAAIINKFHKRLYSDKDNGVEIADKMKSKRFTNNTLDSVIRNHNFSKKRSLFKLVTYLLNLLLKLWKI